MRRYETQYSSGSRKEILKSYDDAKRREDGILQFLGRKEWSNRARHVSFRFVGETIQVSEAEQEYNRVLSEFSDLSQEKSGVFKTWYKDVDFLDTVLKGLENRGASFLWKR